jgi:hypothetical protein
MKEVQCVAPPEENCHNQKNTTFLDRGITTGRGNAIASKELRHFSPLMAILEKRRVTLFHRVDMGSDIPCVSITKNERF